MAKVKKDIIFYIFMMIGFITISYGNQAPTKEGYRLTKEIYKNSTETEIATHAYDTNGYEIKTVVGVDLNGDLALSAKEIKHMTRYTYDKNGKKLSESWFKSNGLIDSITTYKYDTNGNMISKSYDSDADKKANDIETYTYDENGNKLSYRHDFDADGEVDMVYSYTYDSKGNELSVSISNIDGSVNMVTFYNYDGNVRIGKEDQNGDGVADSTQTWIYDDNGNKLSYSHDSNCDNKADNIKTYTYDKSGNMLTESEDAAGDGEVNSVTTYAYDSNGNMLSIIQGGGEKIAEKITIMTYDNDGNMLTKIFYFNYKKEDALTHTYTYTKGVVPNGYKPKFVL